MKTVSNYIINFIIAELLTLWLKNLIRYTTDWLSEGHEQQSEVTDKAKILRDLKLSAILLTVGCVLKYSN